MSAVLRGKLVPIRRGVEVQEAKEALSKQLAHFAYRVEAIALQSRHVFTDPAAAQITGHGNGDVGVE